MFWLDDKIVELYNWLQNRFWNLTSTIQDFFWNIWNVLSYIREIFKAIRFGMGSLLSSLAQLIDQILDWDIFLNLFKTFTYISNYIWWPATVFLSTILLIAFFRIFIAFVFKLFKGSADYNALQSNIQRDRKMR